MARKQQLFIIIAVVAVLAVAGWIGLRSVRHSTPPAPVATIAPPLTTPPSPPGTPPPGATAEAPVAPKEPLAPLVPGSSLTDERFAAISAKIVMVALKLKRDKDWELNVVAYMAKALDEEKISETEYRQYAEALNQYPDRGRAVAQNILDKAQKKLGYQVSMKSLPMFKFDDEKVRQIDKQLKKKLK